MTKEANIKLIGTLTDSSHPRKYWNTLKTKLKTERGKLSHNLGQLKFLSGDEKILLKRKKSQLYENIVQLKLLMLDDKMQLKEAVTNCNQLKFFMRGWKMQLKKKGFESTTICSTFKLSAQNRKICLTNMVYTEHFKTRHGYNLYPPL
jgi:hypothetical protein